MMQPIHRLCLSLVLLAGVAAVGCTTASEPVAPTPPPAVTTLSSQASPASAPSVASGQELFESSCAACHGKDAKGVKGLGKTLVGSAFVKGLDDRQFVAFVIKGRDVTDPQNTTKVAMPPRGGNLELTDNDLLLIAAYVHGLSPR